VGPPIKQAALIRGGSKFMRVGSHILYVGSSLIKFTFIGWGRDDGLDGRCDVMASLMSQGVG
jgi:hypothetical protein